MRFLCDEMLVALGKWLRAAGYDAAIAENGDGDRQLIDRARSEDRILLTRDRKMTEFRDADRWVILLAGENLDEWAGELKAHLGVDWLKAPFTRCLVCNTLLEPADESLRASLPERARVLDGPFLTCPVCSKLYWPGSHVRRMRHRLETFAGNRDQADCP